MFPKYAIFYASSNTLISPVQPLVNGVSVNFNRNVALLNLRGNQSFNLSNFNRNITITTNNNLTGVGSFVITGFNSLVGSESETIAGTTAGTAASVDTYCDLYSVVFNLTPGQTIPPNTTVSLGSGATGTAYIPISTMEYFQQVTIAANMVGGGVTYTVSQTLDNLLYPSNDYLNQVPQGSQFWEVLPSMTAATTSKIVANGDIKIPISGLRIQVTASTGGADFTILQQGAAFK